jgi:formate/nitrite transporter FocA (FNT family)
MADVCTYKWDMGKNRPFAFMLSAFAGGAFVVFGAMLALSVSAGVPGKLGPGAANLMMGLVFMGSLVIIMFSGMCLVTADMAIGLVGIFHRRIGWGMFLWVVLMGYVGNAVGSMFFMWVVSKAGAFLPLPWLLRSHGIGVFKMGMTATQIFAMGVVCTWCLQTAALLFIKANEDIAKIIIAAYGPLAFVAGATEHCIANIGFLALPIFNQQKYLDAIAAKMPEVTPIILHWGFGQYGWAHNQLYTVLGNFIGGMLFVGLVFQLVSNPKRVMAVYQGKETFIVKL